MYKYSHLMNKRSKWMHSWSCLVCLTQLSNLEHVPYVTHNLLKLHCNCPTPDLNLISCPSAELFTWAELVGPVCLLRGFIESWPSGQTQTLSDPVSRRDLTLTQSECLNGEGRKNTNRPIKRTYYATQIGQLYFIHLSVYCPTNAERSNHEEKKSLNNGFKNVTTD